MIAKKKVALLRVLLLGLCLNEQIHYGNSIPNFSLFYSKNQNTQFYILLMCEKNVGKRNAVREQFGNKSSTKNPQLINYQS